MFIILSYAFYVKVASNARKILRLRALNKHPSHKLLMIKGRDWTIICGFIQTGKKGEKSPS